VHLGEGTVEGELELGQPARVGKPRPAKIRALYFARLEGPSVIGGLAICRVTAFGTRISKGPCRARKKRPAELRFGLGNATTAARSFLAGKEFVAFSRGQGGSRSFRQRARVAAFERCQWNQGRGSLLGRGGARGFRQGAPMVAAGQIGPGKSGRPRAPLAGGETARPKGTATGVGWRSAGGKKSQILLRGRIAMGPTGMAAPVSQRVPARMCGFDGSGGKHRTFLPRFHGGGGGGGRGVAPLLPARRRARGLRKKKRSTPGKRTRAPAIPKEERRERSRRSQG